MFRNVIVGVDGRPGGRDAIALATGMLAAGGRLTLVNVHAHDLYRLSGQQPRFDAILTAVSEELLRRERSLCGLSGASAGLASTAASSVADGLHELAREHGADLLVIGSCRHTFAGRVFLGNDTKDALRSSPVAVAVAPKDYAEHPTSIGSVGVGYDGEVESEQALEAARVLAAEQNAAMHLLYAVSPVTPALASMAPVDIDVAIEPLLQQGRDRLAEIADADGRVVLGAPGEVLSMFSYDVDLLVLGSSAHGTFARALLGNTGEYVARHAHCPVLLVPRTTAAIDTRATEAAEAPVST